MQCVAGAAEASVNLEDNIEKSKITITDYISLIHYFHEICI